MQRFWILLVACFSMIGVANAAHITREEGMKPKVQQGEVDIREYLRGLFKTINRNYSIAPEVQGKVRVSDVEKAGEAFEDRLSRALMMIGASCRLEGGIYQIISGETIPLRVIPGRPSSAATNVLQDADHLWVLRAGEIYKVRKSDIKTINQRGANASQVEEIVSVKANELEVRFVLESLFNQAQTSFTMSPQVTGKVTIDLRDVPLLVALENVLRQVDAKYGFDGGVYLINPRTKLDPPPTLTHTIEFNKNRIAPEMVNVGEDVLLQDEKFLYTVSGWTIRKFDKANLRLVAKEQIGERPRLSEQSRQTLGG